MSIDKLNVHNNVTNIIQTLWRVDADGSECLGGPRSIPEAPLQPVLSPKDKWIEVIPALGAMLKSGPKDVRKSKTKTNAFDEGLRTRLRWDSYDLRVFRTKTRSFVPVLRHRWISR